MPLLLCKMHMAIRAQPFEMWVQQKVRHKGVRAIIFCCGTCGIAFFVQGTQGHLCICVCVCSLSSKELSISMISHVSHISAYSRAWLKG